LFFSTWTTIDVPNLLESEETMAHKITDSAVVVLFLGPLAFSAHAITFIQWPSSSGGNDHRYAITDDATDWTTAESAAIGLGGHLASITSSDEQSFINSTFLTGAFERVPLWIGLTDEVVEGTFVWATGESLGYTNWKTNEPSVGNEHYVAINWGYARGDAVPKGEWNNTPLNGTLNYGGNTNGPYFGIVEVVPEPASAVLAIFGAISFMAARFLRRRPEARRRWSR
jgi:Lectin C-type domain